LLFTGEAKEGAFEDGDGASEEGEGEGDGDEGEGESTSESVIDRTSDDDDEG